MVVFNGFVSNVHIMLTPVKVFTNSFSVSTLEGTSPKSSMEGGFNCRFRLPPTRLASVFPVLATVFPVLVTVFPVLDAVFPVLETVFPVLETVPPVLETVSPGLRTLL